MGLQRKESSQNLPKMNKRIRWECQNCKHEGISDEGYYIRCRKCDTDSYCFRIIEVMEDST